MRAGRTGALLTKVLRGGETFEGLPPEVWQVHQLQQKTSWSEQDHARIARLTRRWTAEQRQLYEQTWNWGRPARWR